MGFFWMLSACLYATPENCGFGTGRLGRQNKTTSYLIWQWSKKQRHSSLDRRGVVVMLQKLTDSLLTLQPELGQKIFDL